MKNIIRFFAVMLSMLFLVPCAMPVASYAETTANEDMSVIKTEAYTAVVPKNGIVVSSGPEQFTQTSRLLESTSFPNDDAIVEFDYATTLHEMYNHVLQNNMDITQAQAMDIAKSLTQKIRAANNAAISGNVKGMDYITTADGTTIIDLGRIYDGKLTDSYQAKYVPDSRTTIISEGWSVNPYRKKSSLMCNHVIRWNGLDLYKSSDSGTMIFSRDITVSAGIGFENSGGLSASDALKFGLRVTASGTVTSKISKGFTLNVAAWTKHVMRPYIYYYIDEYEGTYRYYCYNYYDQRYFYVTETRTAENKYDIEKGVRSWTRVNVAHDYNLPSPIPPADWEW